LRGDIPTSIDGHHVLRSGADDPLSPPNYATVFEIEP